MDKNAEIWRQYYEKALSRPHSKRTEFAVRLNESNLKVATDCGCGTGSDIQYLEQQGFRVHGFDINPDSVAICRDRFGSKSLVDISESSFESLTIQNLVLLSQIRVCSLLTQTSLKRLGATLNLQLESAGYFRVISWVSKTVGLKTIVVQQLLYRS